MSFDRRASSRRRTHTWVAPLAIPKEFLRSALVNRQLPSARLATIRVGKGVFPSAAQAEPGLAHHRPMRPRPHPKKQARGAEPDSARPAPGRLPETALRTRDTGPAGRPRQRRLFLDKSNG